MTFGGGIGDCIAIIDKSWLICQKYRSAPGVLAELKHHTDVLHETLEQAKALISEEDVSSDATKQHGLKQALEGCESVLDDLEIFFGKYSEIATKNKKRYFQLLRFIASDVEGLKAKVNSYTTLLTLSLSSLSNLSQLKLQKALDSVLDEYRRGIRPQSIMSSAILDNKLVERSELLEQVTIDLEDKDVHPDSIDYNQALIQSWISKVAAEDGQEEWASKAEPLRPSLSLRQNSSISRSSTHQNMSTQRKINDKIKEIASNEVSQDTGIIHRLTSDPDLPIQRSIEEAIHERGSLISSGVNLEEATASPTLNGLSDSASISSHQSKADDWRPFDRPDDSYVHAMLAPLFSCDPYDIPKLSECEHRIWRAFNQVDWCGRGYLTRPEVLRLSADSLKRGGVDSKDYVDQLPAIVASFDANRDGSYNKDEFKALTYHLMERCATIRRGQINSTLAGFGRAAQKATELQEQPNKKLVIPWGWSRNTSSASLPYTDEIRNVKVQSLPNLRLQPQTFTMMAIEAEKCVGAINEFEQIWLGIIPKSLHPEFLPPLTSVSSLASKFTVFENHEDLSRLSDLDSMLVEYHILRNTKTEYISCVSGWDSAVESLQAKQKEARELLQQIQGFAHCLRKNFGKDSGMKATTQNFPAFRKLWKSTHINFYAKYISQLIWSDIEDTVVAARAAASSHNQKCSAFDAQQNSANKEPYDDLLIFENTVLGLEAKRCERGELHWHAVQAVRSNMHMADQRQAELARTPWKGNITNVRLDWKSGFSTVFVYAIIRIDNPPQHIQTNQIQRRSKLEWKEMNHSISLLPSSRISFEVWYDHHAREDMRQARSDFESVTSCLPKREYNSFLAKEGTCHILYLGRKGQYRILVNMEDQLKAMKKLQKAAKDWLELLPSHIVSRGEPAIAKTNNTTKTQQENKS